MPGIDDFLDNAAPAHRLDLARVNIAGGDRKPFYCAQMRSFWREGEKDTDQVVAETFGLRSLLVDAEARLIKVHGGSTVSHNAPILLRLYPRPRKFGVGESGVLSNWLYLWEPRAILNPKGLIEGVLTPANAASDLLVAPCSAWPDTDARDIRVPHLRLVDGRAEVEIELSGDLATFFIFDAGKNTLFGGLTVAAPAAKLKAVLVPEGIEFAGSLPDPTRDFTGGGDSSRIAGIFRLECDTRSEQPQYLLRLVRADESAITATEDRIAEALSGLLSANAPVTVRYDKRPVVPPIFWPLTQDKPKSTAKAKTGLKLTATWANDFEMRISEAAVDARIRTRGRYEAESGLASLFTKSVSWKRSAAKKVELTILAGEKPPSAGAVQITQITFSKKDEKWTTAIGKIVGRAYSAPLGPVAERLLPIYRAGGGLGPDIDQAPYVFVPINEGWLQLAIDASGKTNTPATTVASAMGGRIFVSQENPDGNRDHGLIVDGAASIQLSVTWSDTGASAPTVSGVTLDVGDARGQLLGFLHVAETSPSPSEALPTLRGGPAATRDLPLWFGTDAPKPALGGVFTWDSSTGSFTASIDVGQVNDRPSALAWLPAGSSPFITNIPLTRTLPSASDPSASRGLVPQVIGSGKQITLVSEANAALPSLSAKDATWYSNPDGKDGHSLVLPTLAGTEFSSAPGATPLDGMNQTRLRFDLPILDELFAWSDPPKKGAKATAEPTAVNLPTALEPERLAETWQNSLNRIALTRTQGAELSDWVKTGMASTESVNALVAPFLWSASLKIEPAAPDAWGSYQLDKDTYRPDSSAEGLGGAVPVGFKIKDGSIAIDGDADFTVAGNAANLFSRAIDGSQPKLIWDSRGFGQSATAENGLRMASRMVAKSGAKPDLDKLDRLRTLKAVLKLDIKPGGSAGWTFDDALYFHVRDLPTDELIFDGASNPIERAVGMNGQAFDMAAFPYSLYEWRLFQAPGKGPKPHDLRWGPFSFKPLRLFNVTFDSSGEPVTISVIGSMRFDPGRSAGSEDNGPFREDDVYLRENLFELKLARDGDKWSQQWAGKSTKIVGDAATFEKRDPVVSIEVELGDGHDLADPTKPASFLRWAGNVAARIDVDIVSLAATVSARLFGTDYRLAGKAAASAEGFAVALNVDTPSGAGVTRAMFHPSKAEVKVDAKESILTIEGRIAINAAALQSNSAPVTGDIVSINDAGSTWLGIEGPKVNPTVDHANGVFTWKGQLSTDEKATLPFRFEAANLDFAAALVLIAARKAAGAASFGSVEMGSAWAQATMMDLKQPGYRMDYQLLASVGGERQHSLDISWSRRIDSPIAWPCGQVRKGDKAPLPPEWLDPAKADQKESERSRTIYIADDASKRLKHQATLNLHGHRVDVDDLTVINGSLTAQQPVRLLAVIDHCLLSAGEPGKPDVPRAQWTTLDHVVITSRALMAKECTKTTFTPIEAENRYRGVATGMARNGIALFTMAGAGFHDRLLVDNWWTKDDYSFVLIGGAAVQFPVPSVDGKTFTAVFPWIDIRKGDGSPVDGLNMRAGTWSVASAELWPATPMSSGAMPPVVIGSRMEGQAIRDQFNPRASLPDGAEEKGLEEVIPFEQAFFEKSPNGAIELAAAPLFLRAMMAVSARMAMDPDAPEKVVPWNTTTVVAGRFVQVNAKVIKPSFSALRVKVKADSSPAGGNSETMAAASLIALSPRHATRLEGYRRIAAGAMEDQSDRAARDEIVELATDLDAAALFGIRVAVMQGHRPGFVWREIAPAFGAIVEGKPLTLEANDIGPSAALGWPSDTGMTDLHLYVPVLGEELPVLSHESGFAARFQMFGWPAYAPRRQEDASKPAARTVEALYLSFGHHIVYERGSAAKLTFDGPAARHLLPAVARRRAPLTNRTDDVLKTVLRPEPPKAGGGVGAGNLLAAAPILPPSIERGTVGRRPGVMEAVVASMTVPGDSAPFDPAHDRFGRPANSGPVAAHQLRNPRSPVLPRDEIAHQFAEMQRVTLDLRRRTYVSIADCDVDTGKVPLFRAFDSSADIARFATGNGLRHDRLAFIVDRSKTSIGSTWDGELKVTVEGKKAPADAKHSGPMLRLTGWVEIGASVFPAALGPEADGSLKLDLDALVDKFAIKVRDVSNAAAALLLANADTPIRIMLEMVDFSAVGDGSELPVSPRWQIALPLMLDPGERRVVPVTTRTIVFGDPSYDRQLASQAAGNRVLVPFAGDQLLLLAADRKEYDLGLTLRFAGGFIDKATGEFSLLREIFQALPAEELKKLEPFEKYRLSIARLPPRLPNGDQPQPEPLCFDVRAGDNYLLDCKKAYEIALKRLVLRDRPADPCPLLPGDRLEFVATMTTSDGKDCRSARVQLDIVADPVIAPPPSVYTVITSSTDRKLARSVLHASGPLPQKIEFPDLLRDLALGHVRRRAIFVWAYAMPGDGSAKDRLDLVKFDRSGGAQLPDE
jgi:hypothetical protein